MLRRLAKAAAVAALVTGLAAGAASAQTSRSVIVEPVNPNNNNPGQPQWRLGVKITTNAGAGGVKIVEIFPNSPAEAVGLKAGMVILKVDGTLYNDPLQVREKVLFNSGDSIDLVYQDGTEFYQVTAQLTVTGAPQVVADASGRRMIAARATVKDIKRVKVADPRKKK
jgi:S1-C subfamily serine protease